MTKPHPLTDEICDQITDELGYDTIENAMRAGADWQLEQDYNRLEDFVEEFSYRGHNDAANYELRCFLSSFIKSYMRLTQEDDS